MTAQDYGHESRSLRVNLDGENITASVEIVPGFGGMDIDVEEIGYREDGTPRYLEQEERDWISREFSLRASVTAAAMRQAVPQLAFS